MSGVAWSKFFWADWRSDPAVRMCSLAARGLWIDMLSFIAEADGYLLINGKSPSPATLARLIGTPESDVADALAELEEHAVFSRTGKGVIYCRRIVKAAKKAAIARENGKKSGGATNGKDTGSGVTPPNGPGRVQSPEANSHSQTTPSEQSSATTTPELTRDWPGVGMDDWRANLSALGNGRLDVAKESGLILTSNIIARWRQSGYSYSHDVAPAVQALCQRVKRPITTWSYFDGAVREAYLRRTTIPDLPDFAQGDHHDSKLARNAANAARDDAALELIAARRNGGRGGFSDD